MITMAGVSLGYSQDRVFENLNLDLPSGNLYGLLGLNGVGKTSLLKLWAGALLPSSGELTVLGHVPGHREVDFLKQVQFVAEDPWFSPQSGLAWVRRQLPFRPGWDSQLFGTYSELLEVDPKKNLAKMSYGQRKKFALAAALSSGASLILLDEPTNGLDIPSKAQFRKALSLANQPDKTIVVSTHQVRDLEMLLDPLIVISQNDEPLVLPAQVVAERVSTRRLSSLEGVPVVWAQADSLGWMAVVAEADESARLDWELIFQAALDEPLALKQALSRGVS